VVGEQARKRHREAAHELCVSVTAHIEGHSLMLPSRRGAQ
jgi:hypothetical protein